MKKNKISIIILLLGFINAQVIKQKYSDISFSITAKALSDSTAFNRLAYMCDVFGPRLSGSRNLEKATDWIISEIEKRWN